MNEEVEEYDEDFETSETEIDEETGEVKKKGRPLGYKAKQVILQFNNNCRAKFTEGDPNIRFEVKSKNEESESYYNDGYYGEFYTLIQKSIKDNMKTKIFKKEDMINLKEVMNILNEIKIEAKQSASDIIKAIENNQVVSEITEEAIERCKDNAKYYK